MKKFLNTITSGKYGNNELLEIKLNNEVLWSSVYNKYVLRYRVKNNETYNLNDQLEGYYLSRPTFTLSDGSISLLDANTTIYLHNGSTTSDFNTPLRNIDIIEIEYNENVRKISFENNKLVTDIVIGRTDSLTSMEGMFKNCIFLKHLYVPRWETGNVTDMSGMFFNCSILKYVNITNWTTGKVLNMSKMFYGCRSMKTIDVTNWDTSNVTDISGMFSYCTKLLELDLSNWNVGKVVNINQLFRNCSSLSKIDFSRWDTSNMVGEEIFRNTNKLCEIRTADVLCSTLNFIISKLYYIKYSGYIYYSLLDDLYDRVDTETALSKNWYTYRFCIIYRANRASQSSYYGVERKIGDLSYSRDYCYKYGIEEGIFIYRSNYDLKGFRFCDNGSNAEILEVITLINSNITEISFNGCKNLEKINFRNFDSKNITDMSYMFGGCNKLITLDLSRFATNRVTNMYSMFNDCSSLTSLDIPNFDTRNVTTMAYMFNNCSSLISLDVSKWNTSKVTNMMYMFANCSSLIDLDVSNFSDENLISARDMFYECQSLTSIDLSKWTTAKMTDIANMFYNNISLHTLNVSNFDTRYLSKDGVKDMFYCVPEDNIDWCFDGENYSNFIHTEWCTSYSGIFPWGEIKLVAEYVVAASLVHDHDRDEWHLTVPSDKLVPEFNDGFEYYCYYEYYSEPVDGGLGMFARVKIINKSVIMPSRIIFKDNGYLRSIQYLNTSEIGTMNHMFSECTKLKSIDMEYRNSNWSTNWNTGTVHDMSYMFHNCASLEKLVLTNFDTSDVTVMQGMFSGCTSLEEVRGLYNWDIRKVKDMSNMFYNCHSLKFVSFSNWDTDNNFISISSDSLTNMSYMFKGCKNLNELDLSSFNTIKVTNMSHMFNECEGLKILDLQTWDTSNVVQSDSMFSGVSANSSIKITYRLFTLSEYETSFTGTFNRI